MSDELDPATLAQLKAVNAAASFAETCAELRDAPCSSKVVLDGIINTLMTELWDRRFSQVEIRGAFTAALSDMNRYAGGEERRS